MIPGPRAPTRITANDALSGTGLANTVVHFTIDSIASATAVTADALGNWSFTPSGLADGPHTIVASQTDAFGNTGTATLSFTLDTTAPVVAITSAGGPTNQTSQTITGTVDVADAGATVLILDANQGNGVIGTATVQSNGSWISSPVTLGNGSHALTAQVTDQAGNIGSSNTVTYTVDTIAPTEALSITSVTGSSSPNNSSITVSGSNGVLASGEKIQISRDGITWVDVNQLTPTSWSFVDSVLATANFIYSVQIIDAVGNVGTNANQPIEVVTNGGVVSTSASSGLTVEFTGIGGTLQLGSSPAYTGTINAISTANGPVQITGTAGVTTSSGDAIDLSANGGTQANPANLTINLGGAITGAVNGINAVQNGSGDIAITANGNVVGEAGNGITAEQSSTGTGRIVVTTTSQVTGTGTGSVGLLAEKS